MVYRILRKRTRNPILLARFAIDPISRAAVEREVAKVRQSVVAIIGETPRASPFLVGSGTLLIHRDRPLLVTAAHVFLDNPEVPLGFFDATGRARSLAGDIHLFEAEDLAIKLLSSVELDAPTLELCLPETALGRAAPMGERFYASVVGYPATASRRMDDGSLDTPMEAYFNVALETPAGLVAVDFDKKQGALGAMGHLTVRDPFGKSGGAIFGVPMLNGRAVLGYPAHLVGVPTRWNRRGKTIEGAGVATLCEALETLS